MLLALLAGGGPIGGGGAEAGGGVRPESAALLLSGATGGDLPVAVAVAPVTWQGGPALAMTVTLGPGGAEHEPGSELGSDPPARAALEWVVYALDGEGHVVAWLAESVPLGAEAGEAGFRQHALLATTAAPRSVRILVRQRPGVRFSLQRIDLEPAFASAAQPLEALLAGSAVTATGAPGAPFTGPSASWPAGLAEPTVGIGAWPGARSTQAPSAAAWTLAQPGVSPGASPAAPPALSELASRAPDRSRRRASRRQVEDQRLSDLRRLAAGDAAAAERAAAAEAMAVTAAPESFPGDLEATDTDWISRLAVERAETLLPIALFHEARLRIHAAAGRPVLAHLAGAAARQALEALAESGAEAERRERRTLAGAGVRGLAGTHFALGLPRGAADLLGRAVDLAPEDAEAWLALLFALEVQDRRAEALAAADRLLALAPGHREGLLRRALLSARSGGGEREVVAGLERLAAPPAADWVAALAAEELARRDLAHGAPAAAVRRLAAVANHRPKDASLSVALAYAELRTGHAAAADQRLAAVATGGRGASSPRYRYSRGPTEGFAATAQRLAALAITRQPALAAALDARGGQAGTEPR